jgi:hypothetical protein
MKKHIFTTAVLAVSFIFVFTPACNEEQTKGNHTFYTSLSSLTDTGDYSAMLDKLPDDVTGICEIAKRQTIHHNLFGFFGLSGSQINKMKRIWPPEMKKFLQALGEMEPKNLYEDRELSKRIVGACISESHFLVGLLRHKHIPARVRPGYFKDIREKKDHILKFWRKALKTRGVMGDLLREDPGKWQQVVDTLTQKKNDVNHYIEHWVCEYWDKDMKKWRLLDANNTFLKAHSDIDVVFHLPRKHFQFAHEAWIKMRSTVNFNPDQYAEEPRDGRSHIRSQLLWDFYGLLNHDLAGHTKETRDSWTFIKDKKYAELTTPELEELDMLAGLLAVNPSREELTAFYLDSETLRIDSAEKDPYSFVYKK